MRLIALAVLSLPLAAQAAPSLSIEGECPGLMTINITGLTPGANMTMLFSAGLGEGAIPAGGCRGTVTGLDPVRWAMTMPDVDGDGTMTFNPFMPESACGKHVQIMDSTDCSLSNIVTIGEDEGEAPLACGGHVDPVLGGCWYTSPSTATSCDTVCADHGGVDLETLQHTGNDIGFHFWPSKADGGDWETIECSSTDNNTNWGANGAAPNVSWTHSACHVNCSCNE